MNTDPTSVGIVTPQHFTFATEEPFPLDSGARIGPVTLAYETYGQLNAEHTNAILICHALSGSAHAAGYHAGDDRKPGWWDDCIGPGKAFDTDRFFVICSNVIGGCYGSTGPTHIDPKTREPYAPQLSRGDDSRYCARPGQAHRSFGHRPVALRGRRLLWRHAGAGVGGQPSHAHQISHSHCDDGPS